MYKRQIIDAFVHHLAVHYLSVNKQLVRRRDVSLRAHVELVVHKSELHFDVIDVDLSIEGVVGQ